MERVNKISKVVMVTVVTVLALTLLQVSSAYASGRFGQTFDDGNNDGTATYDVSHLQLDESHCITDSKMIDVYVNPVYLDVLGNVSTTSDVKIGDENTYVFSDDQYYDISHLSLNCGKWFIAGGGKNFYVPFVSLAYTNDYKGHESSIKTVKYHVTGSVSMWFDGHAPVVEPIDLKLEFPPTSFGEWTDEPTKQTIDGYHNEILWMNSHHDLDPYFDAVGQNGMIKLIKDGKFEVHLDTITCTVVD